MQFKKWKIGRVTVTKVTEIESVGHTKFLLPHATLDEVKKIHWLSPHFANDEGYLKMSIHSLIMDTGSRRILIDTCIGNDKQDRSIPVWNNLNTPYLQLLVQAGYPPESIDTVFCTHLHVDHVGWNTKLVNGRWVPTFPNARYIFGRFEFDFWNKHRENPMTAAVLEDSILPIVNSGRATFIENGDALCKEMSVFPTPGHSPGHLSVRVVSDGEEGVLTGDVAHNPCQMAHVDWASTFDTDTKQSTNTRQELFSHLSNNGALVIGGHYDAGRIKKDGDAFRFEIA
jgi:glyoxylase-like metal-dependent hydrolase (beta-lactamase superfamily II)